MSKLVRPLRLGLVLALLVAMAGCAATVTHMRYGELDVQNKMSQSIFLQPVAADKRTVFVQVRNTSDKPFDIEHQVKAAVAARGYRIVNDPGQAQYLLQANVLSVGKTDKAAYETAMGAGFGGVAGGAVAGALLGGSRAGAGAALGGLTMGVVEAVTSASTKVNWYAVLTDLQVSERATGVTQQFTSVAPQGAGQSIRQQQTSASNWRRYQTRISSSARKVNLQFEEALPLLRNGITQAIAGIF